MGSLLVLAGGLAAVLGLLALLVAGVKRMGGIHPSGSSRNLRVTDRAGLGQRQGVAVVEVDDVRVLVGFGEGGVRFLTELDALPPETPDGDGTLTGPVEAGGFARIFRAEGAGGSPGPMHRRIQRAGRLLRERIAFLALAGLVLLPGAAAALPATGSAGAGHTVVAGGAPAPSALPVATAQEAVRGAGTAGAIRDGRTVGEARNAAEGAPVGGTAPSGAAPQEAAGSPAADPERESLLRTRLPDLSMSLGSDDGEGLQVSGPVGIVLFMGFLTLLPTLLLLMTSFTRILVVLHLLKQAIGTQTAPPSHLVAALALLLTGFVMAPTLAEANRVGVDPWVRGEVDEVTMLAEASVPFRHFMVSNMRQQDLETFMRLGRVGPVQSADEVPLVVVMTAFVTSELRAAFQMGFALFLPFVVIDLVVASVLMSMGMFMLPPVMVSLPFKLLLFVMVDGWTLVMEGIVRSFPG